MKTTLNVREDLYRKAKAQAALQGKSLSKFLEESLEKMLSLDAETCVADWAAELPKLSPQAFHELESVFSAHDFRQIDPDMWK